MRPPTRKYILIYTLLLGFTSTGAGCLGGAGSVDTAAYVSLASTDAGGSAEFGVWVRNVRDGPSTFQFRVYERPASFDVVVEPERAALRGGATTYITVRAIVGDDAPAGLHRILVGALGEGDLALEGLYVNVEDLNDTRAARGIGVRVLTAGWYDNGTLFYTNWKAVWDNEAVPRVRLSEEAPSFDPLKVYVGGRRGERPPEPYNRSGYVPVIEGFDAALLGMRAGESRIVHIPPEKAYTREGNEEHALYGEALNFAIHVVAIDVLQPDRQGPLPPIPPTAYIY